MVKRVQIFSLAQNLRGSQNLGKYEEKKSGQCKYSVVEEMYKLGGFCGSQEKTEEMKLMY